MFILYIYILCVFLYSEVWVFFKLQHLLAFKLCNPKIYLAELFNNSSSVKALPLYIKKPITSLHNAKP